MKKAAFIALYVLLSTCPVSAETWVATNSHLSGTVEITSEEVRIDIRDPTEESFCLVVNGPIENGAVGRGFPIAQIEKKPFKVRPVTNDVQVCYDGDIKQVRLLEQAERKYWEESVAQIKWKRTH